MSLVQVQRDIRVVQLRLPTLTAASIRAGCVIYVVHLSSKVHAIKDPAEGTAFNRF